VGAGTTQVRATVDGVVGVATLDARVPVATVTVSLVEPNVLVGATTRAVAVVRDATGGELSGRPVTWASANGSVATVTSAGVVTAVGVGSAQLSATSEGVRGSTTLTVSAPGGSTPLVHWSAAMLGSLPESPVSLVVGRRGTLVAGAVDVLWRSDDDGATWTPFPTQDIGFPVFTVVEVADDVFEASDLAGYLYRLDRAGVTVAGWLGFGPTDAVAIGDTVVYSGTGTIAVVEAGAISRKFGVGSPGASLRVGGRDLRQLYVASSDGSIYHTNGRSATLEYQEPATVWLGSAVDARSRPQVIGYERSTQALRVATKVGGSWNSARFAPVPTKGFRAQLTADPRGTLVLQACSGEFVMDSTTWRPLAPPPVSYPGARAFGPDGRLWLAGASGTVEVFDGSAWSLRAASPALVAVSADPVGNFFVVGDLDVILRWSGGSWSIFGRSPFPQNAAVIALGPRELLVSGIGGTARIVDGNVAQRWPQEFAGLARSSSGIIGMPLAGAPLALTNGQWLALPYPGGFDVHAAHEDPQGRLWIGGQRGELGVRSNGTWTVDRSRSTNTLAGVRSIWTAGATTHASTARGDLLQHVAGRWIAHPASPAQPTFLRISGVATSGGESLLFTDRASVLLSSGAIADVPTVEERAPWISRIAGFGALPYYDATLGTEGNRTSAMGVGIHGQVVIGSSHPFSGSGLAALRQQFLQVARGRVSGSSGCETAAYRLN